MNMDLAMNENEKATKTRMEIVALAKKVSAIFRQEIQAAQALK
ncbi:hypothetical protein [Falsochrobactrum tianjinense]|nr:hypothetical protein [Falsochrobactrum sp. TDYN1]